MGELIGALVITFLLTRLARTIYAKVSSTKPQEVPFWPYIGVFVICSVLGSVNFGFVYASILYGSCVCIWMGFDFEKMQKAASLQKGGQPDKEVAEVVAIDTAKVSLVSETSSKNEADRVEAIVKKRIEDANAKKLPDLVEDLWVHQNIRNYPSWMQMEGNHLPAFVQKAKETTSKNEGNGRKTQEVHLKLDGKPITFAFTETGDFDGTNFADLDVIVDEKTVLSLGMSINYGEIKNEWDMVHWSAFKVAAYIPGNWENDLRRLKTEIENHKKMREQAAREDPKKLGEQKKRFGIE